MKDITNLEIHSFDELSLAVQEYGFLPFFKGEVPFFSIEEHCAPECWFPKDGEGVWEWKGPVIRQGVAYGKFFGGKAGFIRLDWYRHFANYRRDGYDFDALYDDQKATYRLKCLYDLVIANPCVISKQLKEIGDYGKGGKKGFDTLMTDLQMKGYIVTSDFVYPTTKGGKPYGWGLSQFDTPERLFGEEFTNGIYDTKPEESFAKMFEQIKKVVPYAEDDEVYNLLKR